ncbi:MFS transporter [Nocardioides sp. cx-173]|uniref:MFS transporter n=1 Tax=Nocardioides sp. cx-173 TaxID=2898796 RepID=UPI001E330A3B|nr:MFS transporter [Nocardioides sp. cx-173]MCD4526543.1 MFS transporter [Nocardioides sp. cx-173]UGB41230.1 MFS transporter [Nocardioides sp. cx-173]
MTSVSTSATHAVPDTAGRPVLTVAVLCFGGMITSLTQTFVIPLQGELPVLLSTSAANASWVVTATLLAGAVAMPIAGSLGDLFGKQRVLLVSTLILLVGSLVCALSDTLLPMLAGRTLQGLSMGFVPVGISLIRDVVPPGRTGTAMAAVSATLGVGGSIGLPLAAWIADSYDFHALFWFSTVLAVLAALPVALLIPRVPAARRARLDLVGALGIAVGLVAVLVAVTKGREWGWDTARPWSFLVVGLVVLVAWGRYELAHPAPLCDLRVTARRPVLLTNIAAVAIGFGMMAQAIIVPQLLQLPELTGHGLGQSMVAAGLWTAPAGLVMMAFAPLSSALIARYGPRVTLAVGAAVLGSGYLVAVAIHGAPWHLLVVSCVTSAGVGIGYAAMPALIMDAVPASDSGAAVGVNALMRSIGTTTAAALVASILAASVTDVHGFPVPSEDAMVVGFLIGAGAAFLGMALTLAIPRRAAAAA